MNAAVKYNPERLMTVLLAPVVSEKSTFIADKHEQVIFRVLQSATKPGDQGGPSSSCSAPRTRRSRFVGVQISNVKGKQKRFGQHMAAAQLEEGLREPEAGSGNQFRGGGVKPWPSSRSSRPERTPFAGQGRQPRTSQGSSGGRATSIQKRGSGRNNNGHITMRHKGGGHKHHYRIVDFKRNKDGIPVQGRAARVRPEPQREPRARCSTPTASAATSSRRAAWRWARSSMSGSEAPIKAGQHAAAAQHPGRLDGALRRDAAGQGRADGALGRRRRAVLAREGIYAQLRLRSGEIRKVHVDCRATIGEVGNEEHSLRSIGKAGANAGAASGRRCAASR
jgi:ribosomal protein L2